MKNNIKLSILGGDERQAALARMLSSRGFECAVWGVGGSDVPIGDATRCSDWRSAVGGATAIILPLPASTDGVRVSCPLGAGEGNAEPRLKLNTLLDATGETAPPILGGRLTSAFCEAAASSGRRVFDYFDSEELKIRNAVPTAEGAVAIAMNEIPRTVRGARVAVIGYGRVGRCLASLLIGMGADVTVAARRRADIALAESEGADVLVIDAEAPSRGITSLCDRYDVLFNTVPARLFDAEMIARINRDTLIVDIASVPGGFDMQAARECGVNVIWALSLPGKYAPVSAGRIIGETVLGYLTGEGLI